MPRRTKYEPGMVVRGATLVRKASKKSVLGYTKSAWLVRYPWGLEKVVDTSYLPVMRELTEIDTLSGFNIVYRHYKLVAAKRGFPFDLTKEFMLRIMAQKCHYCGCNPSNRQIYKKRGSASYVYSGLDRRDNSSGYTVDNVVPCCSFCNRVKLNLFTEQEALAAIKAIMKVRGESRCG